MSELARSLRLSSDELCWRCDEEAFHFRSTEEVESLERVVGQEDAVDALFFGLSTTAHGQNVFVRGLPETGRLTLVENVLSRSKGSACATTPDLAYVHDFTDADRPR